MAERGQSKESGAAHAQHPPAMLVSQMLLPEMGEPFSPARRRLLAHRHYAEALGRAVRRMPPGWRRSVLA